ncbi:MAG: FtsW/RodA/SpoVE family cell cycle protein [Actinomycetia bacterium]|nr:FtsW/RodA/SpoVE family cell cycle protein [Actinomycetes bacterium]
MTRQRTTELGLVLVAVVVTVGTYTLAVATDTPTPSSVTPFLIQVVVLLLGAHLAVRWFAPAADGTLLPLAALLNGLGYSVIVRLDPELAANQAAWTLLGIVAFVATLAFVHDTNVLARYRWTFALAGIVLLLAPLLPGLGRTINGARLWIRLGPFSFQPGEAAKLAMAIFVSGYLVEKRELLAVGTRRLWRFVVPDLKHLGPLLAAWGASLLVMVAERDLGSSLLVFSTFVIVVWVGTGRAWYLGVGGGLFVAGAVAAWAMFEHVQSRVRIWLDPWQDPSGEGYQLVQATFALASGGLTGTGPGLGSPERIPARETDFIFAVIGEELGFVGATAVICGFLLFIGAGLRVAVRARDEFGTLLAASLTIIVGFQAFIIMGGVLRVMPLTGITLPFISYGGSSLLANYVLLALLLRVSDESAGETRIRRVVRRVDAAA